MTRFFFLLIGLLSLGLPLHGGITVFLPEYFRWWKESILALLVVLCLFSLGRNFFSSPDFFKKFKKNWDLKSELLKPLTWAIFFLVWGFFLVLLSNDFFTNLVAYRYLGFGFFAFGLCLLLCESLGNFHENKEKFTSKVLHIFCTFFVIGTIFSVLFGLWAQFLGGFGIIENFYAKTISSWVPGQTLPLYHEAGENIRMQGLSSGPIELAHLCLLGLVALFYLRKSWPKFVNFFAVLILLIGIYFSASRAVELVLILSFFLYILKPLLPRAKKIFTEERILICLIGMLVFLGGTKFFLSSDWAKNNQWLNQEVQVRGGTIEHFTRPVEAIKSGSETFVFGQLGKWGPAARAKNLRENNDDKAPIAENVFADWWVQLGFLGFVFGIGFLVACLYKFIQTRNFLGVGLILAFFIPMNLATIFDMTPISLSFFIFLALLVASSQTSK